MPSRDGRRLQERFDPAEARDLLTLIENLENDFYDTDAHIVAKDLSHMETIACDAFQNKHPQIPLELVRILSWCYTFDFR
jgi:hypothetical protein